MKYQTIKILVLVTMTICGGLLTINGQLPDEAVLPEGKGAWAIDQNHKTNIAANSYLTGYVRIIILSNGKVFHRKSFDVGTPATPWCQVQFTAVEMRDIRSAIANTKPAGWQPKYGEWLGLLTPFRNITFTKLDAKGEIIRYGTLVNQDRAMTNEMVRIAKAIDAAGELAFSSCAQPEKVDRRR